VAQGEGRGPRPIINRIADFHAEMTQWRHQIHAHPETAFAEHQTAEFVAGRLASFGISVERGIAGTGVVGTLHGLAPGRRAIALRADMDALHIDEQNAFAHASRQRGRMHACGHDGHTAMLLGAAKHLAETRNFAGTIHFIFSRPRRTRGGARRGCFSSALLRLGSRFYRCLANGRNRVGFRSMALP
jgi:metal-dependent amidase/aminoacylase/carboxypeptidase family protein